MQHYAAGFSKARYIIEMMGVIQSSAINIWETLCFICELAEEG